MTTEEDNRSASDPAVLEEGVAADSVTRNAVFALAFQMVGAICTAAITLVLVRVLEPSGYGVYALALGLGVVMLPLCDLGVSMSTSRFIAEHSHDRPAVRAVFSSALRLKLLVSTMAALLLIVLAGPIAEAYEAPDLKWALRAMSLSVFAQSFMTLLGAVFISLGHTSLYLRVVTSESVLEGVTSIGLALAGAGAAGALMGRTVGYSVAVVVGVILLPRLLGKLRGLGRRESASAPGWQRVATYAMPLVVVELVIVAFGQIDVLLIGAYLGPAAAGVYEAPLRLGVFLHQGGLAIAAGIAPPLARVRDRAVQGPRFQLALRYAMLLQGLVLAPLIVWAGPIVGLLLGDAFGDSVAVLRALAPFIFLAGLAPIVAVAGNYLGEAGRRLPIAVGALLINVAIDVIFIPRIGLVAGALGSGLGYLFYVPAQYWLCARVLGLNAWPLLLTFGRTVVAAAAMAGVLLLFGTEDLSLVAVVGGGVLGLGAYVAALVVSRELGIADLRGGVRTVRYRLRRGLPR